MAKTRGGVLIALAILSATVYKTPQLLFNIPFGIVPWLAIGGHSPPFRDYEALARCVDPGSCPWLTEGDVLINACAKCGTNWMMTVVHELRTWDKPHLKDFDDILDVSPWVDLFQNPYDFSEKRHETWGDRWNQTDLPFKQYKGHMYPYRIKNKEVREILVPIRERRDLKVIVMVRNPEDMISSLSKFGGTHDPQWYRLWGMPVPTDNLWVFLYLLDYLAKPASPFYFFSHWWEYRHDPNVLLLHYSNVFKDTRTYVELIADFLDLNVPAEAIDEVLRRTSIKFMKKRNEKYRHRVGYNKTISIIKPPSELKGSGLISKGGIGTGSTMSDAQKQKLLNHGESVATAEMINLLYKGFETEDLKNYP